MTFVNLFSVVILSTLFYGLRIKGDNVSLANIATSCVKPNFQDGYCLPLKECPSLSSLRAKPNFQETIDYWKCPDSTNYCCNPPSVPNITLKTMNMPCTTAKGKEGICLRIQDCPWLYDALENPQMSETIKNSLCPIHQPNLKFPIVCCEIKREERTENVTPSKDIFSKQCGKQLVQTNNRIFGGTEASLGQYPWLGLIIHKRRKITNFGCSSVLVTAKFLLTAAHCIGTESVFNFGPLYEVVLGEHDRDSDEDCDGYGVCAPPVQRIKIRRTYSHPMYDTTTNLNDIGIIQLKHVVKFNDFVQPICLFENQFQVPAQYIVSGWGKTKDRSTSNVKMEVSLPPFSEKACQKLFDDINYVITDRQICAGGVQGRDSCNGDSGGPLMYVKNNQWYAAGVVSYGYGCGNDGWPGIYTKISSYEEWITESIGKMNALNVTKNKKK